MRFKFRPRNIQVFQRLRGPIAALRDRLDLLMPVRRILAVEIAGHQIIGAVAEGKGRRLARRRAEWTRRCCSNWC